MLDWLFPPRAGRGASEMGETVGHISTPTPEQIDQPELRGPRFCPKCGGTQLLEASELEKYARERGYSYVGIRSSFIAGKNRREIHLTCSKGHTFWMILENFRAGKGCYECGRARIGAGKRIDPQTWAAQHGLRLTGTYTRNVEKTSWECLAAGHRFVSSYSSLRQKPNETCTACYLTSLQELHHIDLLTNWDCESTPTKTKIRWRCRACNQEFQLTRAAIGLKLKLGAPLHVCAEP